MRGVGTKSRDRAAVAVLALALVAVCCSSGHGASSLPRARPDIRTPTTVVKVRVEPA